MQIHKGLPLGFGLERPALLHFSSKQQQQPHADKCRRKEKNKKQAECSETETLAATVLYMLI